MKAKFWGVRGSTNISIDENAKYGCNTTCIEINSDSDDIIIFDAGTGIYNLARDLIHREVSKKTVHILLTHGHWDHIIGFPHFKMLYNKDWTVNIYAVKNFANTGIKPLFEKIFDINQWPIPKELYTNNIYFHEFEPNSSFQIGSNKITTIELNHPGGNTGYRVDNNSWTIFFSGDHEHTQEYDNTLIPILQGVDLAIVDGSYTKSDYEKNKQGWGHTPMDTWVELAKRIGVEHIVFTHYATEYNDQFIDNLLPKYKRMEGANLLISFAYEGLEVETTTRRYPQPIKDAPDWIVKFVQKISKYNDITTLLDFILLEARKISNADAGTIYLVENEKTLSFEYTQNDTLFKNSKDNKHLYFSAKIPINDLSIAGYVANNSKLLNIEDVYELEDVPFKFNNKFDQVTGYHTKSLLTVPMIGIDSKIIGVIQLINSMEDNQIVSFSKHILDKIQLLSTVATNVIQKGQMSIELISRMLEMSQLKDPKETGAHVRRVGTVAAEIYMEWARRNNIDAKVAKLYQDQLRVAAMLHDIGKIGIPDEILKKPGKLTSEEFAIMEKHCHIGAKLFENSTLNLDNMSYEIALHHHQKFNGKGYTGSQDVALLKGRDIPLCARITSIADVYDALVSKRCYKDAFEQNKALSILKEETAVSFDPELIECFMSILPTIDAIYEKFKEEDIAN